MAIYFMSKLADHEERSPLVWGFITFLVCFASIAIGLGLFGPLISMVVVYFLMFLANALQR